MSRPVQRCLVLLAFLTLLSAYLPVAPDLALGVSKPSAIPAAPSPATRAAPSLSASVMPSRPRIPPPSLPAHAAPLPTAIADLGALPLAFVPNRGQSEQSVRFSVGALGGRLFFTLQQLVLAIAPPAPPPSDPRVLPPRRDVAPARPAQRRPAVLRVSFEGANPNPAIRPLEALGGVVNELRGADPRRWRTNLPTYAGIVYAQLYDGIDLEYRGRGGKLKSSYLLSPGADVSRIGWHYSGASRVQLTPSGALQVTIPVSNPHNLAATVPFTLTEQAPIAWQTIGGRRVEVSARYVLTPSGSVGFALGNYDHSQPLTLDPSLTYSTYLGGNDADNGLGIAVDDQKNIYITGETYSTDFPTATPAQTNQSGWDIFVSKLDPSGSELFYSSYLGGSNEDHGQGIAVDATGRATIVGWSWSVDYPTYHAYQSSCAAFWGSPCWGGGDAVVTTLTASGALAYSSYLGGADWERGSGIALDRAGLVYITGTTFKAGASNPLFPIVGSVPQSSSTGGDRDEDAFVAKLDTRASGAASLRYSSLLGGSDIDEGHAIALDAQRNVYITGLTRSTDFPTSGSPPQSSLSGTNNCPGTRYCFDAFVTKLNAAGELTSSSDALGRTTRWTYNLGGQPIYQADPRWPDTFVAWAYDDADHLIERSEGKGAIAALVPMRYDALGRRVGLGGTTFAYDPLGQIVAVQNGTGGTLPNETVQYGYDATGERTQLMYPDGTVVSYTYTLDGQLNTVRQGTTTLASYSYDSVGRLQTLTHANGTTTTASYDRADRLTDLHTQFGSTTVSRFQYTLDRASQRTQVTETLSSASRSIAYSYDGLGRFTDAAETQGTHYAYSYDDAGNRTGVWLNGTRVLTHTFDAADQVVGYTYDAAGNLTNDGTTTYTYDAAGRLTQRGLTSYSYNGDGVLLSDGATQYTQDLAAPLSQVLATTDGVTTTDYLYGAERLAAVRGGTRIWYGSDALGSARQTLNDAGAVLGSVNYDPWGQVESGSVPMFGFTGEVQDAAGMVYLRARWYDTDHGTFTTRDSWTGEATVPQTLAYYLYVHADPVNSIDPSGKFRCDVNEHWSHGYHDYRDFCLRQRARLEPTYHPEHPAQSIIQTQALAAFVTLFADPDLPGGQGNEARQWRRGDLSAAAERLEFILWYTAGKGHFAHDRIKFSDQGFALNLQDHQLMENTNGTVFVSNQVNHFLTAVDIAYQNSLLTDNLYEGCLIGHEQNTQNVPGWRQCLRTTQLDIARFETAVIADIAGDYESRDCLLHKILPNLSEDHKPFIPNDPKFGNSAQDLRLSLKGWIFGKKIQNNEIVSLRDAQSWLQTNLGS